MAPAPWTAPMLCLPGGVTPGVGGTAAFMLPVGKWQRGFLCGAVHGLKIPSKAGASRQSRAPGERSPEKARSRGTEALQLILQMRKRRW